MAFNFSRLKSWLGYENISNTDLNAEFNNVISKAGADTLSSANSTAGSTPSVSSMQVTSNPGGVGSENLSLTTQTDVQQLRYVVNEVIGGAQWYSAPAQSISQLNNVIANTAYIPNNRIISGRKASANNQPMFLVPGGSTDIITLSATSVNLVTFINGTSYTFTADASINSLSLAPSSNNTCLVSDSTLAGAQASKAQGERGTFINIGSIGSGITALNGSYAAFKHSTEYFIAEVDTTNNRLKNAWRGVGFDNSDAWIGRTAMSNGDTITLMKLAWVFGANTGALDVTYSKPSVSYVAPVGPSIGDYWLDLSVQQWKKYGGISWVNQSTILLGLCIQDTAHCVCARSFDFFKAFSTVNSLELEYVDTANVRSNRIGSKVSSYGTFWAYDYDFVKWNTTSQADSGVTIGNSTTYWCYITDLGDRLFSDVQPYDRRTDLLGHYHPAKPWRCVGEFGTDGSANVTASSILYARYYQTGYSDAPLAPTVQQFTSTGTTTGYLFTVTSANATLGATFTNNSKTFTVLGTIASGTQLFCTGTGAPTASGTLTKSGGTGDSTITFSANQTLGTYTTPSGSVPAYIRVRLVGGGGGSAGSGTSTVNAANAGTPTVFGINFLVGNGGGGGIGVTGGTAGGAGGSASIGTGAIGLVTSGNAGGAGEFTTTYAMGGMGGSSPFGMGALPQANGVGVSPLANSGAGASGGSGSSSSSMVGGGGGGSGGYIDVIINSVNLATTYYYSIGVGGATGTGVPTNAGATGAAGFIFIEEHYQ